jgi:lipopolysaccharide exporter
VGLKEKTLAGGMWIGASVGVAAVLQILQLAFLARILTATDIGLIAIVTLMTSFVEILVTMGISNSIVQRRDVTTLELSSLHWLNVLVGAFSGVILFFSAPAVAWFFGEPRLTILVQVVSLVFLITPFGQVFRGSLEKGMHFRAVAVSEVAGTVTIFACAVSFAALYGVIGVVIGTVCGYAIRTVFLVASGWKLVQLGAHFKISETRRFLEFGIFQSLDSIVGFVSANVGSLVIGKAISAQQLGGYNLAYNFAVNTPGRLNPIVTRVMFPAMSQIQHDKPRLALNALKLTKVTGIVTAPVLVLLVLLAPEFTRVVLGDKWIWITPLLQILAIVGYLRALGNPMGVILMAANRMRLGLIVNLVKAVATISAVLAGAALWGTVGVALALAFIAAATVAVNFFLMRHILRLRLRAFVGAQIVPLLVVGPMAVVVAIVSWAMRPLNGDLVTLIVATVLGAAVYVATVFHSRVSVLVELRGIVGRRVGKRNA